MLSPGENANAIFKENIILLRKIFQIQIQI